MPKPDYDNIHLGKPNKDAKERELVPLRYQGQEVLIPRAFGVALADKFARAEGVRVRDIIAHQEDGGTARIYLTDTRKWVDLHKTGWRDLPSDGYVACVRLLPIPPKTRNILPGSFGCNVIGQTLPGEEFPIERLTVDNNKGILWLGAGKPKPLPVNQNGTVTVLA